MNLNLYHQLSEAYQTQVYPSYELTEEEYLDIQEWVESLIDEGYNLDDYTDDELYAAYLEDIYEERRPISRGAREQISDIISTSSDPYTSVKNPQTQKSRVRRLMSGLERADRTRGRGELPVGRMSKKMHSLLTRPRKSGADKESDFSRAEYIASVMRGD